MTEISRLGREEGEVWDDYVRRAGEASYCQLSGWRRVIETAYGHQSVYLWARDGGKVKGVLPLVLFRNLRFGLSLVSMPYLDDGGISADDYATATELYRRARGLCDEYQADVIDLRHRRPSGLDVAPHGSKVTFSLPLSDPERMWSGLDAKVRNQVRKAMKSGLQTTWGGLEALDAFYDVFATNMRDLGSPVHARRFFAAILSEFRTSARLILVKDGDATIAGGVCIAFRDTVIVPWAAARRDYRPKCPNNLLYWEAIRWSCQEGFGYFDFGRSSPGSGTYAFKKQWGAVESPLAWQCFQRKGGRGDLVDSGPGKYDWLIKAWGRLPVAVTRLIGPPLRKHLSN
jgi:FemAB-related protein (PEP-CTERM system-associated)